MKNKIYLIITALLFTGVIEAQIGIQTDNPLGIFHVDPKRDTNAAGTSGTADDVVVTSSGQVGIGTVTPTAKLDIRGTFRLRDGNQAEGKMLVSDVSGNAQWGDRPRIEVIEVDNVNGILSGKTFTTTASYSGVSITIPEGTWQVMFQVTCTSTSNNMFWDLCESSTTYSLTDVANRRAVSSGRSPISVTGVYFVYNTSKTPKTYYIWGTTRAGTASYLASGTLWALPIG
ncbi:hypothetical protein [Dysgonomonas macrotermitis]|uniref:Uncharacterized protein n=1 Tax=Dysgonomonas macrotermitis TaxID=1346286 RepID=A0A1M4UD89_9BACT|nr:hypothetical protein [Dysgonomonas macrotermitis]SHE54695.1 hypothetical protein SAMN05444362_101569 [Dysgonomonas macrotermitis]